MQTAGLADSRTNNKACIYSYATLLLPSVCAGCLYECVWVCNAIRMHPTDATRACRSRSRSRSAAFGVLHSIWLHFFSSHFNAYFSFGYGFGYTLTPASTHTHTHIRSHSQSERTAMFTLICTSGVNASTTTATATSTSLACSFPAQLHFTLCCLLQFPLAWLSGVNIALCELSMPAPSLTRTPTPRAAAVNIVRSALITALLFNAHRTLLLSYSLTTCLPATISFKWVCVYSNQL